MAWEVGKLDLIKYRGSELGDKLFKRDADNKRGCEHQAFRIIYEYPSLPKYLANLQKKVLQISKSLSWPHNQTSNKYKTSESICLVTGSSPAENPSRFKLLVEKITSVFSRGAFK